MRKEVGGKAGVGMGMGTGKGLQRCGYRYSQRYLGVTHAIHYVFHVC
jgi:hypothetical protein